MSAFRWKSHRGTEEGSINAATTDAGAVLRIEPDDDFYAGELDQWQASELMLHFYSLLKKAPGDKPPEALVMMAREICKKRSTCSPLERAVYFSLGFAELCELFGVEVLP